MLESASKALSEPNKGMSLAEAVLRYDLLAMSFDG